MRCNPFFFLHLWGCRWHGVPQVIGAIDGTQVPIRKPKNSRDMYLCRQKYPSLNVSAVCDATGLFTDVFAGWTGSAHDSTVLQDSPLWRAMQHEQLGGLMRDLSIQIEGQAVSPLVFLFVDKLSCLVMS